MFPHDASIAMRAEMTEKLEKKQLRRTAPETPLKWEEVQLARIALVVQLLYKHLTSLVSSGNFKLWTSPNDFGF